MKMIKKVVLIIFLMAFFLVGCDKEKKEDVTNTPKDEPIVNLGDKAFVSKVSNIVFTNVSKSISLGEVVPTLDKFGVKNESFTFTIQNISSNDKKYILSLMDNGSTILNKMIRYQIIKNGEILGIYTLKDDGIIDIGQVEGNKEINYQLKFWLAFNSDVKIGSFNKLVSLVEKNDELDNSGASAPLLVDGMIPVYYDSETLSFYKADTKISYYHPWYNYEQKIYANAVTVSETKREEYLKSSPGTKISLSDINSMWVWIPRFNYQINNGKIDVHFVSLMEEANSAFTFNKEAKSGFWVSKFEAGLNENDECIKSSLTIKCNNQNQNFLFKPGIPLMNKITMANLFYGFRMMELKDNIYGFNGNGTMVNSDGTIKGDKNNLDIHMIKNNEWEAVGLLALSSYGNSDIVPNNTEYTGNSFVNNIDYPFNDLENGVKGSTTNNVTGVYDFVGGRGEYVMLDANNKLFNKKSNSGFTTKVKEYYYDKETLTEALQDFVKKGSNLGEIIVRGGYKRMNSGILSMYTPKDYVDKISIETNSRAIITIKEKTNG